jgi:hypothetical protein
MATRKTPPPRESVRRASIAGSPDFAPRRRPRKRDRQPGGKPRQNPGGMTRHATAKEEVKPATGPISAAGRTPRAKSRKGSVGRVCHRAVEAAYQTASIARAKSRSAASGCQRCTAVQRGPRMPRIHKLWGAQRDRTTRCCGRKIPRILPPGARGPPERLIRTGQTRPGASGPKSKTRPAASRRRASRTIPGRPAAFLI